MLDVERLFAGPRGRRLLLQYALESDRLASEDYSDHSFSAAVFRASHLLDPGRGTSRVSLLVGRGQADIPAVAPETVAELLEKVELAPVTPERLRSVLRQVVDTARYWQEPEGEDVLASTEPVRVALRRMADHIVASPHTAWWSTIAQPHDQWHVTWLTGDPTPPWQPAAATVATWRQETKDLEQRARTHRPDDVTANWSGEWWTIPPATLPHSTRLDFDESPVGLWYVEDSFGPDRALATRLSLPVGVRVLEITSAADWATLCEKYPADVTWEKRHDWYRTTGRDGQWVMPDWTEIATEYQGVHLTVAAYLEAAGAAIPVSDNAASVVAGWNPDQTWWFIDPRSVGESIEFELVTVQGEQRWVRVPS